MKIWLITDTHFGHRKMEEFCGRPSDFEARIFKELRVIEPGDLLIHLGDFCIGNDEAWHVAFFSELPEVKRILIQGNHDRKSFSWYMEHGWNAVFNSVEMNIMGKKIRFSHEPATDDQLASDIDVNIHGHLHNTSHHDDIERSYKNDLLSIEYTNYKPVLLRTFLEI